MPEVRVVGDPDEFAAVAEPVLRERPAEHTIIGTILHDVRTGARAFPGSSWMAVSEHGAVVGLAMWTPPFAPYLGPMPTEAAEAVAAVLAESSEQVPGINGEAAAVRAAVTGYQRRRPGAVVAHSTPMRLYELGRLVHPPATGSSRTAHADDRELVTRWFHAFGEEIDHPNVGSDDGIRIRLDRGALVLWEVDGHPVSMAGHTAAVAGVARVGPVYTPPVHRGQGYGSAVSAEASRRAGADASAVVLFADLANPTSNKVYVAIGYRGVRDYLEVTLTPASDAAG